MSLKIRKFLVNSGAICQKFTDFQANLLLPHDCMDAGARATHERLPRRAVYSRTASWIPHGPSLPAQQLVKHGTTLLAQTNRFSDAELIVTHSAVLRIGGKYLIACALQMTAQQPGQKDG